MSKKGCELCSNPARMFCESDQASLCWDCDEKVHAANFLVAKHSRTLLCYVCHSPTPWKASGPKLGPTVSVCNDCAAGDVENRGGAASSSRRGDEDGGYDSPESESDDGEYYSDSEGFSEEEEEEEDGENQVVPWSESGSNSPPAAAGTAVASYSGSQENVSLSSWKRTRENAIESEDVDGSCSAENLDLNFQDSDENYSSSLSLLRSLKMRRRNNGSALEQVSERDAPSSLGTNAIVEKLRRLQHRIVTEEGEASAMILGLCKLTRD